MADKKISEFSSLAGSGVDVDNDVIEIIDTSEHSAIRRNKKITVKELIANTLSVQQSGSGGRSRDLQGKVREIVSVTDFENVDGTDVEPHASQDNSTGIQRALNAADRVFVPPHDTLDYIALNLALDSNHHIYGAGWRSVIKQKASASTGDFVLSVNRSDGGTTAVSGNKRNIVVRDICLKGLVATESFSEFCHLFHASAVSDLVLERVKLSGFKGDGLYIGSGESGTAERHNERVTVRDCYFDGENNDNRNGISVIDCDGLTIDNNTFVNCTKSTMPGAIDIEPDSAVYHIIRNVKIINNKFKENGGTNGSISMYFPDVAWTVQPSGFVVANNHVEHSAYTDFGLFFQHAGDVTASRDHDVKIYGNTFVKVQRGFRIWGAANVRMTDNTFDDIASSPLISFSDGTSACRDITLRGNTFKKIGSDNTNGGGGIALFDVNYIDIDGNRFIDCGKANGTQGYCLDFNTGTSSYVAITNNRFENPGSKTTAAIVKEAGHTFTASTNKFTGNVIGTLGNTFDAYEWDTARSWTPVLQGASSAGEAGTSLASGQYWVTGGRVTGNAVLVWSSHTGTGGLQIAGLPIASINSAGNFAAVTVDATSIGSGATTQLTGRIGTNSSLIEIKQYAAGTGANIDVATNATSGNIVVSFSYRIA